jgi:cellobiose epimerase
MARELLERILVEAVVPFWVRNAPDGEFGGYRLHHDLNGAWKGPAGKALVTQARTLWFFSRLLRSKYARAEYAELAKHGFDFFCSSLRDAENGGFYWETSCDGSTVTKPSKHLYGQAFALYALTEYAAVSRDGSANDMARELFRLIDARAHDLRFGGYVECFTRDWSARDEGNAYLPVSPPRKSLNTHLHLLEAFTQYYRLTADELARRRIVELLQILSSAVVRKNAGACTNEHERDWTAVGSVKDWRISYGHDIENGWMIVSACEAIEVPSAIFVDLYRSFANYALAFGFDRRSGGFYHAGLVHKRAGDRSKVWWVQAEAMLGMLKLHRITGEPRYYETFEKTLDWVAKRQTDWRNGDWFAEIDAFGRPRGDKAGAWKGPYHNGRALLECIELLDET